MRNRTLFVLALVLIAGSAAAQPINSNPDVNTSKMANYQNECAIAKDPTNHQRLFASCNNSTSGLFAARSTTLGSTWVYPNPSQTIADGTAGFGPNACCDPTLAWDNFGNLFITYLGENATTGVVSTVETILSTDGGQTFTNLASFGPASVDQPTVAVGAGSVWIVWNQGGSMVARGAAVTGLGTVGAFGALQSIPGTSSCSFGDLAISPAGAVVQVCESPTGGSGPANLLVNIDADGLGPGPFGAAITATSTQVGGFHAVPPQNSRTIDAEAGLAFDIAPGSPHNGRLYLVYTDENAFPDTKIMLRFSDTNGATWSAPQQVDNDPSARTQFLPRVASNALSGNVAICWHDARNSATNTTMQEFCTMFTRLTPTPVFFANAQVGDGVSNSNGSNPPVTGLADIQFGDYSGLAYFQGRFHPIWADDSNSTGDNPDGTTRYDAYTDRADGLPAANEGDPHMTTVDGVHYDFQSAGEFTVLRDGSGMEIQTRQTPVATASPVTSAHTGLTNCVSLNSAVAARVNGHRVSYEPNTNGLPDPSGLQLRIDGVLTTPSAAGVTLGLDGRVARGPNGNGIEIDFPDGTVLVATPLFWTSQSKWYINLDVFHTSALEGVMGALAPGSWLPYFSNGTSAGPIPASLHQRYVDLYQRFAESWRVTNATSLFDYAPGTSTATFTVRVWPSENPPCTIPKQPTAKPMEPAKAKELCSRVIGRSRNADCVADVTVTGEPGFAKLYLISQQLQQGGSVTALSADRNPTRAGQPAAFTAVVQTLAGSAAPLGSVRFGVDGSSAGDPVKLGKNGVATFTTSSLSAGRHTITAVYDPAQGSVFVASSAQLVQEVGCVQPPSGMVAWYPMDEALGASSLQDINGGNNATPFASPVGAAQGPQPVAGVVNGAMTFPKFGNGLSGARVAPSGALAAIGSADFTIDAWVKFPPSSAAGKLHYIVNKLDTKQTKGYSLYIISPGITGNERLELKWGDGTINLTVQSISAMASDQWHHVAVTFARNVGTSAMDIRLFVDGVQQGQQAGNPPTSLGSLVNSAFLEIGRQPSSGDEPITIDELEFFNRALTQTEIHSIFNAGPAGKCKCVSPPPGMVGWWPGDSNANDTAGGNDGTLQGNATFAKGMVLSAFSFAAASDYVSVPSATNLNFGPAGSGGDISIDAWIETNSSATVLPIVDKRDLPVDQSIGYIFFLFNGKLAFQLGDGTFFNYISSGPDLRDGKFHHVAVTVVRASHTGGTLYADGNVVLQFDPTNRPASLTNDKPLFIGHHAGDPTIAFVGLIDEVEIFNRALSHAEIEGLFSAGSAGKCTQQ